jgi:repressor LexA
MTPKQLKVVLYAGEFISEHGYSPTLDEIADGLGVAKPTVQQYLRALEAKGVISRQRYAHRSIEIVDPDYAPRGRAALPLLGRIAAGEPIEAVEVPEMVDIGDALGLGRDSDLFLLEVKGDSMVEEGICDGDYVIVEKRETAQNGQTVVALLPDNTATLKKLYKERRRVRLQPAHPDMEPIYAAEVAIQGVVRGVFRPLA